MEKLRIAVVGYGNIGKYTVQALQAAPDMEIAGIVRRNGDADKPAELAEYKVVRDITELGKVDVAILATPTRSVEEHALKCLALGINTVDSFDIHTSILDLRRSLSAAAKQHGAVSIISAGLATGVGFAMKDLLENFFYGISLMTGRIRVGDYIECDGVRGKVESITYQSTQIATFEGSVIAFLNSALFSKNFKNLTKSHGYEFVKIPVGVAYGTDISKVREVLIKEVEKIKGKSHDGRELISAKRDMDVYFESFGDSSVNLFFTCWVLVEERFFLLGRINEAIYNALNKNGIAIPFPQRDVHIIE